MILSYLQKNKKELEDLIQTIRIYSQGIGIKIAMLIMKRGKRETIELPNQKKHQNAWREGKLQVVGNIGSRYQMKMKERIWKEYPRRTRKLLQTKLLSRNLIKGINIRTVPLVRYSGKFLKLTNGPKAKNIDVYAQGFTSERWYTQIICVKKRRKKRTH